MSRLARDWAKRQRIADPSMKAVLLELAYMHHDGRLLYPSQRSLATAVGLAPRAVWSSLLLLERFGLIVRTHRSNGNHGRTSDAFALETGREFTLTREAIKALRAASRQSRQMRVTQPAPATGSDIPLVAPGAYPPLAPGANE